LLQHNGCLWVYTKNEGFDASPPVWKLLEHAANVANYLRWVVN
jgi:hypothetical protein